MIHVYCGDGKGKTTAAVGLAVRMAGSGKKVKVIQFLKGSHSGEVDFLRNSGIAVSRCDRDYGFFKNMTDADKAEITKCHNENLRAAISELGDLDMLVLDEVFAALGYGLLDGGLVKRAVEECGGTELVLTGRDPDGYFTERADYVSEIRKVKHPFDSGAAARRGVEY